MNETDTDRASNVIIGVIFLSIFVAMGLLAIILVIGALSVASSTANGPTITAVSVVNETGAWLNSSGFTVAGASYSGFEDFAVAQLYNYTSGILLTAGNFTASATGVLTNATSRVYNNVSLSYGFNYNSTATNTLNTAYNSITDNVVGLVVNFFALMPTIGTILAVVILITGLVLLVIYVRRMGNNRDNMAGFQG